MNGKTTALGIIGVIGALAHMASFVVNGDLTGALNMADINTIIMSVGLIFAKDWNVTGGNIKQTLPPV